MCNQSWATFRSVAVSYVKHGSDVPACNFQYFLLLEMVRTFLVLMFWDRLRRCPLTVASQVGNERQASIRLPFLGPSPYGASGAVPKESCLVVNGAADDAVVLGQHQTTNILNRLQAGLGLRPPVSSFTYRFVPFPLLQGLERLVASRTGTCPFSLAQWSF